MGNSQSSSVDSRFASASRAFSQKELQDLESLFLSLAFQSHGNGGFISPSVFQDCFGLHSPLGERMFDLITQKRNDQKLTFEDLVIAKRTYEKGTGEEIEGFIYQLLDVTGDGILRRSDIKKVLRVIFEDLFPLKNPELKPHEEMVDAFLYYTSKNDGGCSENSLLCFRDFRNWCSHHPCIRRFLGNLLVIPPGRIPFDVPNLHHSENIMHESLMLRKEFAWHICGALSQQELGGEWELLYQSASHGFSFNTLLGNLLNHEAGPTILIIKDTDGYIYGGYASNAWENHADFYGDMKCFLFQLYPMASIFRPTGINKNLQWCAVNFSSEGVPNGIGFGGRINHFGLFVTAGLDEVQSFPCTTFASPCLLKTSNRISPGAIECWGINLRGKGEVGNVKRTVLQRFKEDQNMLNMLGLANSTQ